MKKRIGTTQRLGDVLNQVEELNRVKDPSNFQQLLDQWSSITNALEYEVGTPTFLKHGHLTIELPAETSDRDASATAFQKTALERTLKRFGVQSITFEPPKLKLAISKSSEPLSSDAKARTTDIKDDGLRQAMASLLTAFDKSRT